jgi:hypothetical protein
LLLISGFRGLIKVIDCQSGAIAATLVGHGNAVNELRAHPVRTFRRDFDAELAFVASAVLNLYFLLHNAVMKLF